MVGAPGTGVSRWREAPGGLVGRPGVRHEDWRSTTSGCQVGPGPMAGQYNRRVFCEDLALGPVRLEFEEIVELGEDEQEAQLVIDTTQADGETSLGSTSLNQHESAKPR